MCYPSYRESVETEVSRCIQARKMFTAWDITCYYGIARDFHGDTYDLAKLIPAAKRSLLDSFLNRVKSRVATGRRA